MVEPHWWTTIDDVIVSFTIPGAISDESWNAFVADIEALRPRYCLALSVGRVEIGATQRRRSTLAVVRTRSSMVVITDNRMTRGLAMSVSWFGAKLDAFSWRDLERALAGLEITEDTHMRLLDEARGFHASFGSLDGWGGTAP